MPVRPPSAVRLSLALTCALALPAATPGTAQGQQDCKMLFCSPSLTVSPSAMVTNVFDGPRVRRLSDGAVRTLDAEARFAMVFTLTIPTTIPRTSAFTQLLWTPFADRSTNPFTGYATDDGGAEERIGNAPLYEFGLQLDLLPARQTGGWLRVDAQVIDQFGPAGRRGDDRTYTHKLNLALDAAVSLLRWLSEENWFRHLELYTTLDYLATGLPRAGDEVPRGELVYLDDASPWTLWAGLTIPVAPIAPKR